VRREAPRTTPSLSVPPPTVGGITTTGGAKNVRSADEFDAVQHLIAAGMNDCAIAPQTGVPRRTVWDWRCRPQVRPRDPAASGGCGVEHDFSAIRATPYCYVLGLYLGDGCISRSGRVCDSGSYSTPSTRRSSSAAAKPSTCSCQNRRRRHCDVRTVAPRSRSTPNTGPACCPNTVPARST